MPYWFDGNNLMGISAAIARRDRASRRAFLLTLYAWRKTGGGSFLVYFDGDDPADSTALPGVAVRYSAPESTDTLICRRLREIERPGEVIVVTNDLELSSNCRNAGAVTFTWRQFSLKMHARARRTPSASQNADDNVDVDEWMRYFGLDKPET